jgi:uncharacterized membrane protein YwaF
MEHQEYLIKTVALIMTVFIILTMRRRATMSLKQTLMFMIHFWSEYCTVVSQLLGTTYCHTMKEY